MENSENPVNSLQGLAALLMDKLKENQTNLTVDFQNMEVKGPGPQGAPGEWRLNGKVNFTAKSSE